ncbi:MAG TPA: hypothetical protein VEA44_10635 [Caulobacter sp.]|nr:hypothetical protein [Caulobacter sp.]
MKADLSTPFLDRSGKPIPDGAENLTLRSVMFQVLDVPLPDDIHAAPGARLKLAQIGHKVQADQHIDLPAADTALFLERAARVANANLFGQLVKLLDPAQLEA